MIERGKSIMVDQNNRVLSSWLLERQVIGDRIRLYVGVTAVGRQHGSAVRIPDSTYVSRKHAEISVDSLERIVLKDLNTINGTYVNGSKIQNSEITLNENDCIGVGVSDDSEPNLIHPIYKLLYVPLPGTNAIDKEKRTSGKQDGQNIDADEILSANEVQSIEGIVKSDEIKSSPSAISSKEQVYPSPSSVTASAAVKSVPKPTEPVRKQPTLFSGDIIILSDDEEDVLRPIKIERKQSVNDDEKKNLTSEQNVTNQKDSPGASTSLPNVISKASSSTHQANQAVVHAPILPEIKRELIRTYAENVVEIFGDSDGVILESVKSINPLLYTKLNGQSGGKKLVDGDTIDLLSDAEDEDRKVECFGALLPADTEKTHRLEKKNNDDSFTGKKDNRDSTAGTKSPLLFENSLNSSKNSVDEASINPEQVKTLEEKQDANVLKDDPGKAAEELAEYVDLDEDMMFSQMLINDIKSEMMCDNYEDDLVLENAVPLDIFKDSVPGFSNIQIKKEIIDNKLPNAFQTRSEQKSPNNEIENDVWITIDDDDEELEHKVSDWSTKLLSQKMNMSQVFEEDSGREEEQGSGYGSEDVDDFFNEALVDDVIATLAMKNGEIKKEISTTDQQTSKADDHTHDADKNDNLLQYNKKSSIKVDRRMSEPEKKSRSSSNEAQEDLKGSVPTDGKQKKKLHNKDEPKSEKKTYSRPSVIEAPYLPIHKGKHRGVSAEIKPKLTNDNNGHLREERHREELKRKRLEKPEDQRRKEREEKRKIKESRKEQLKKLADKQSTLSTKEPHKRKNPNENEGGEKKKAKIKVTAVNRGALLAEDIIAPKKRLDQYRIPKTKRRTSEPSTIVNEPSTSTAATTSKYNPAEILDQFGQEISKADNISTRRISNSNIGKPISRSFSLEEANSTEASACNAPTRNKKNNKITFASMQKNFIESRINQKLLEKFANHRFDVVDRNENSDRPKKRVRFNETPVVHYIERVSGANKRVDRKDIQPSPRCADREKSVRLAYAIVDKTAEIISHILEWCNEWLINRNAQVDAASDVLLPMPNQFASFEHYKSIILPLMRLEFISTLERDHTKHKAKSLSISADQVSPYLDRYIILGRCNGAKCNETKHELVVLEWGRFTTFAFMSSKRVGFNNVTLVYEVLAKDLPLDELRSNLNTPVKVIPMIELARVEFGAFNAVYQLEQSPLLEQILNPMKLCKIKQYSDCDISYNGCDQLNSRQKDVLIRTYRHAIDPTPNITLIQGPPGTGKTCLIANLVHQLLYGNEVPILDQKVLICAQSNAAVDVIAEKLFNMSQTKTPDKMFRLIRFGVLDRVNSRVQHATLPKIIERSHMRKLKATYKNLQVDNKVDIKEYLRSEMMEIAATIEHIKMNNVKGTVQENVLLEKQQQIDLMRYIVNGVLRPEDERSLYNWHLKHANVVCTTLSSCVKLSKYVSYFDVCIIDEATQCTEPWTLMPLKFGINTLVLVGDTQQLPATVMSKKASDFGLGTSLFTRIQRCIESVTLKTVANDLNADKENKESNANSLDSTDIIFSLRTQYRMHPEICKWPNSYFYKNELIDDPRTYQFKTPLSPFSVFNLTYSQDNNCRNGQIANELEAKFVARLVRTLDGYIPMKYNSYGVITPYALQRRALEGAMRVSGCSNVTVNTIDSYQGTERDVIIISNARTSGVGFLSTYQRLNVALTRPKKCLILCGNFKDLETVSVWHSLLKSARERGLYHEISAKCIEDMHRTVIPKIKISKIAVTNGVTTTEITKEGIEECLTTANDTTKQISKA
ncbi:unnamed protein product [Ceratitis capitata]|uniref:(Mediterranean fruit fly) hypothetical protein n=1 Tax=Ceratitis capitata TaxID=7213 RepID=A0A811V420_CERCA|nr:unnamed protein product [Ceratitis capitata]